MLEKANEIASVTDDTWVIAVTSGNTGIVNTWLGKFEIAYLDLTLSVDLFLQSDTLDNANLALCYSHMAYIHESFGNHEEAISLYEEALFHANILKDQFPNLFKSRNDLFLIEYDLAVCLSRIENYEKAEQILTGMISDSERKW